LTLHHLRYRDGDRDRSILYRASLDEMVVPYGDPGPTQRRKNAFDVGEYGMGMCANSLELGCDCLGLIRYFDADVCTSRGAPLTIKNAICMHEEDYGILWKHTDRRLTTPEVRRSRRLVISSISTVENYEYGFFWYLYQDGSIQFEIKLTGVLSLGALQPGERSKYGTLIAPQLYGPNHQHFFNMRLDFDLAYTRTRFTDFDPAGNFIPGAPAWVAAGGVTFGGESGWFGALRGRYFGPRPLIEDDSVRSQASLIFNARAGYKFDNGLRLQLDVLNLFNAKTNQIEYYYLSRLPGEPIGGVADRHVHPAEPLAVRLTPAGRF
jgi:hypothetical protein